MKTNWTLFGQVLKATEGGISQSFVRDVGRALNIRISIEHSPLVGHYAVYLGTSDKRKHARFSRELYVK